MKIKTKFFLYLSIVYSIFCLQFDYLVTMCMEKVYGEIFYTHLEANILVQQTHNINVILFPLIILLILYLSYSIIYSICNNVFTWKKTSCFPIDCIFVFYFTLIGTIHFIDGSTWFIYGWF